MATTFEAIGIPLPADLAAAKTTWLGQLGQPISIPTLQNGLIKANLSQEGDDREIHLTESYEGELSSIFVFPLDASGRLILNPNPIPPPMSPDLTAANEALIHGSDLRTVRLENGLPVRLLTYATPAQTGFDVIQLGRPFGDQELILNQFLKGLLLSGAVSVLFLGLGSWWLAGKSLSPVQKSWEMQQDFIANASHELRTPLTLIRAGSEVALRHTPEESGNRELLEDIVRDCRHMAQLVEDLLLLSRLDAKQITLHRQVIPIQDLTGDVERQFEHLANEQNIKFRTNILGNKVTGDWTRLRQVLLILLDNALQHTPSGGTIELSSVPERQSVRISVSDTGEGISNDDLEHVFERFYQANLPKENEHRGNGLGLSIAKSLIEAQDGHIMIASERGKGTTVSFVIPASRGQTTHQDTS